VKIHEEGSVDEEKKRRKGKKIHQFGPLNQPSFQFFGAVPWSPGQKEKREQCGRKKQGLRQHKAWACRRPLGP